MNLFNFKTTKDYIKLKYEKAKNSLKPTIKKLTILYQLISGISKLIHIINSIDTNLPLIKSTIMKMLVFLN
jgi:hypothetical protein